MEMLRLYLLRANIIPDTVHLFSDEDRQEIPNRNVWSHISVTSSQIECPAEPPDLTPFDFYLRGHLKSLVWKEKKPVILYFRLTLNNRFCYVQLLEFQSECECYKVAMHIMDIKL